MAAPRAHDSAQHILALWELKLQKGQGRPFAADHDLFLGMLDIISSVAFGMEGMSSALQQEAVFLRTINPKLPASATESVSFDRTTMSREVEALLDIPEMLAIGQGSPFPKTTQILAALFRPKHARAFWHQRSLMVEQTTKALKKVTDGGEDTRSSALDYLVLREMKIAERLGRKPNSYSPAIRNEVILLQFCCHADTANAWCSFSASCLRVITPTPQPWRGGQSTCRGFRWCRVFFAQNSGLHTLPRSRPGGYPAQEKSSRP